MLDKVYKDWLISLKGKIRSAQLKAAVLVNSELITLYWDLGKMISEKENVWGSKLIAQIGKDLKDEFPDMQGLSISNLKYCKRFYQFYHHPIGQQPVDQLQNSSEIIQKPIGIIWQQLVAQIPWGHNILIFSKSKDSNEALFYIHKTLENAWSRDTLGLQIKSNLYKRQGKAITNFKKTLPDVSSDLAHQLLKDPYNFEFLSLTNNYK